MKNYLKDLTKLCLLVSHMARSGIYIIHILYIYNIYIKLNDEVFKIWLYFDFLQVFYGLTTKPNCKSHIQLHENQNKKDNKDKKQARKK